jgi:hypothetical protein
MHGIELFRLMLGYFEHLHAQNLKAILLELLDDVADCVPANGVRFDDGQSALKCFHLSLATIPSVINDC